MRCANCGETDSHTSWEGTIELLGVQVRTRGQLCRACQDVVFAPDEIRRQEHAVAEAVVERGIRAGNEFSLVRKLAGLRAADVAAILDVTPETVSRWERGKVPIPRAIAYVVADLFKHPGPTRQRLEALAR